MLLNSLPVVALTATVACALSILLLSRWAPRLGLIDQPGGRKRHHQPVPLVGGIGIFIGVLAASLWAGNVSGVALSYQLACGAMLLVGVADDRHDISPRLRLVLQAAIAVGLVLYTGMTVTHLGDLLGIGTLHLGWASLPFTIVAMVALINAFNMMDGLDGLAGGVGFMAFLGLTLLGLYAGRPGLWTVAAAFVGALAGFLFFNAPLQTLRRKLVFMGDAGSTFLGFAFAASALALVSGRGPQLSPAQVLWLVPIPIFELFTSTFRRAVSGMSPMEADLGHYHHRLLHAGWPVAAVFTGYFLFSALSLAIGVAMHLLRVPDPAVFGAFVAWFVLWNIGVRLVERNARPAAV